MRMFRFLLPLFVCVLALGQSSPTVQLKTVANLVAFPIPSISTALSAFVTGRVTENDGAGGTFFYQAASVAATNLGTVFKPASTTGRWVRKYENTLDVRWFGAIGDGSTDNSTAIQNAIASALPGQAIRFPGAASYYRITVPLVVSNQVSIIGDYSHVYQATASTGALKVVTNNVTISGLRLTGQGNGSFKDLERAVWIEGEVGGYLTNVVVEKCIINSWGGYGVYSRFSRDFRYRNNKISNIGYAGIAGHSVSLGTVAGNSISSITPGSAGNVYGVTMTRISSGTITSDPRSSDVAISGNTITDAPLWAGIDTHGGMRIAIVGNTISNALTGIEVVGSANSGGAIAFAPQDITVSANSLDSGLINGAAGFGIVFTGATGTGEKASGAIIGNVVRGFGDVANSLSGAIRIDNTQGLVISGNTLINPSPSGITLSTTNINTAIIGNSIIDPWANAGLACGIRSREGMNTSFITANTFARGTNAATVVASAAIRSDSSTDRIGIGENFINVTNYAAYTSLNDNSVVIESIMQANADFKQAVKLSGSSSPPQITSNQNDYNPSGFDRLSVLRMSADAFRDITGIQSSSNYDGRTLLIHNIGSTTIALRNASASSFATNRFDIREDKFLSGGESIALIYDGTATRWKNVGISSFPFLTTAQRVALAAPIAGYQVFDSDLKATFLYDGSFWRPVESVVRTTTAASETLTDSDYAINADPTGGSQTINLPTAVGRQGHRFEIKKKVSVANTVTIDANGAQTIDGALTRVVQSLENVVIESDGANWFIKGEYPSTLSTLTVTGAETVGGALTANSTLAVAGTVTASSTMTVSGDVTVGGSSDRPGLTPAIGSEGTDPGFWSYETDAAADSKLWVWKSTAGGLSIRAMTDAGGGPVDAISFARSGTTIGEVIVAGTSTKVNGPFFPHYLGTGSGAAIYTSALTPEGSITAAQGSICLRTGGGAGTSFYVKESGSGNTGWIQK